MSAFDTLVEPGMSIYCTLRRRSVTNLFLDPFWDQHEDWFKQEGYVLRREYYPGWVKTWKYGDIIRWEGTRRDATPVIVCSLVYVSTYKRTHGHPKRFPFVDAFQTAKGRPVMLKKVDKTKSFFELEISRFLSSEPRASDSRNHCVPILDVLGIPDNEDVAVLVMPPLHRYNDPKHRSIDEAFEFFRQLFEVNSLLSGAYNLKDVLTP